MEKIENKVAVITGASSGMGMKSAQKMVSLGAKVVISARREDRLADIADDLGDHVLAVPADVSKREDMENLVQKSLNHFGKIDMFWNNAGVMPLSLFQEGKVDEWDKMIDINLKGVLYGIHAVLPHMLERGKGHIMATSSVAGIKTMPLAGVYCGTKYAVRAVMDTLRQELAGKIKVTTIYPGAFATELGHDITSPAAQELLKNFEVEFADTESIADAVIYAMSQPDNVCVNDLVIRPLSQDF